MTQVPQVRIGPDGHRVDVFRDEKGRARCNSRKRKRPETDRCMIAPVKGSLRCRLHGGTVPKGPANINWKTGKQSRYQTILGLDELAEGDISMLDMRRPVRVTEEVLSRLAERMRDNDTPAFREEAAKRLAALRATIEDEDATPTKVANALRKVEEWVDRGRRQDAALRDIATTSDKLSSQIKRAWDVRTSASLSLGKRELEDVFAMVITIVREEVGAPDAARVFERVRREIAGRGARPLGPGPSGEDLGETRAADAEVV